MTEFLTEALHAPVGTVFVVAGLIFLGIAIIGKISGKIEPGRGGRIAAGFVGGGLLLGGLAMHVVEFRAHPDGQDRVPAETTATHTKTANTGSNGGGSYPTGSDGSSGSQPAPGPEVYTSGQILIRGTWSCDLDVGSESISGDFWWEQVNGTERYIVPRSGAAFAVLGRRDFDAVSYADLTKLSYSNEKINGSNATFNRIPQGTVIAAKTKQGRFSKFVILEYGYNLRIAWVTYSAS